MFLKIRIFSGFSNDLITLNILLFTTIQTAQSALPSFYIF